MDVLLQLLPAGMRAVLRVAEQLLLIALAAFVLMQSYDYAQRMFRIGRVSDMAGVPMWIPHGTVLLGFGLILIVAIWGIVHLIRRGASRPTDGGAKP
jgi:TRAP-type C4-dicarboxylate transport system permease small subunit